MENVIYIASYIAQRYKATFQQSIDEMKLHKLLYFVQRESIIEYGSPLFVETFQAWRYGPVMVCIRECFAKLESMSTSDFSEMYGAVFEKVFKQYAVKSSISLSDLSHGEYSWRHAREGKGLYDACTKEMLLDDIIIDAERAKKRRLFLKRIA